MNLYWSPYNNFGDKLSPVIIKKITGIKPKRITPDRKTPYVLAIGSILQAYSLDKATVWGTGAMWEDRGLKGNPDDVRAVRGPLTRKLMLKHGIDCPELYGDPGLLLPLYYKGSTRKRWKLGIVPHLVDLEHEWVIKKSGVPWIKIISLRGKIESVINQITACENIMSSSLHGLVTADAYKIPSLWVEFSDKVWGKGFKFRDYQMSLGDPVREAFRIQQNTTAKECLERMRLSAMKIDTIKLRNACPGYGKNA